MDTYQDWLDARDNAREANRDYREAGAEAAEAEAYYYKAKALAAARLKAENYPVTYIELVIKGDDVVSDALLAFRLAEARLNAAKLANQLFNNEEAHTYDLHKRVLAGDSERF